MSISLTFLDVTAFKACQAARSARVEAWRKEVGWTTESSGPYLPPEFDLFDPFVPPGSCYYCPWYFNPAQEDAAERIAHYRAKPASDFAPGKENRFLSQHYWNAWADKRPPLLVVCPNGQHWLVDQVSTNGTGWTVSGEDPALITCSPSIAVSGYHGFLQNGRFTADCERPHAPNGVFRDGSPA